MLTPLVTFLQTKCGEGLPSAWHKMLTPLPAGTSTVAFRGSVIFRGSENSQKDMTKLSQL